jgi:hypothetical protein
MMAKMRKVTHLRGIGSFLDPFHLRVEETSGRGQAGHGRGEDRQVQEGHHRGGLAGRCGCRSSR